MPYIPFICHAQVIAFIQPFLMHVLVSSQVWLQCSQVPTPLQLFGERAGQPLVATSAAGRSDSRRDKNSGLRFLVDTGTEVSIIPPSVPPHTHRASRYSLQAVNQSSIATFETRSLTLNLGLRHSFQWIFIVADVMHAILGADFLHHFGLSVDIQKLLFTDTQTQLQVNGMLTTSTSVRPSIPILHRTHTRPSSRSYLTSFALAVLLSLPSILSPTTYAPLDLRFQRALAVCLWNVFALPRRSSTTCWT